MTTHQSTSEPVAWHRRAGVIAAACAIVASGVAFAYAGNSWAVVLHELLTDGLICLAWLAAAGGIGALCSMGVSPVPESRGTGETPVLLITFIALGLGVISLIVLGLGLLGWLNRITGIALIVAGLLAWALAWNRARFTPPPQVSAEHWLGVIVMPFLGIALVAAMMPPGILWKPDDPHPYDVMEYHLQVPREWHDAGRVTPLEHNVFSYFPMGMEMHYLLAMHLRGSPWGGMYLCQLMHLSFIALTVAALWSSAGALAALAAASAPWLALLAGVAYNEGALLLFGTLGIIWLLRAIENEEHRLRAMALAGALGGFACGAKLTAVVVVVCASIAGLAFALRKRAMIPIVVFGFTSLLTFSPWLIRTAVWSGGNPVFPEAATLLGSAHFSPTQVQRWQAAHSPAEAERGLFNSLARFRQRILFDWRYGFAVLPLGVIALLAQGLNSPSPGTPGEGWGEGSSQLPEAGGFNRTLTLTLSRGVLRERGSEILLDTMLAVMIIFWLGFTHLQSRFFILAIPMAAIAIARVTYPAFRAAAIVLLVIACGFSFVILHRKLIAQPLQLIGLEKISDLLPVDLRAIPQDKQLQLAGDAAAFWYQIPMSRLHYRTVFDVDAEPRQGIIEAWTDGWDKGEVILVSPDELTRFARTYKGIPAPSSDIAARQMPYFLDAPDPIQPQSTQRTQRTQRNTK